MKQKATLKEVAKVAGVSPITVSRFVNTPDLVSHSAREKIVAAIGKTGYIPNAAARQLKTSQSNIVFFMVPNIRNDLYAALSHELMLRLAPLNKSLFICDYNFQDELEQMLMQEIFKHRPAAIVLAAGDGMGLSQLQLLNAANIPVVQIDRINENITDSVNIQLDNYRGGQLAAEYLLAQHIRRAVVISGNTRRVFSTRIEGFKAVCSAHDLALEIIEMDLLALSRPDSPLIDLTGETGYFLLNSDIANRFLLKNLPDLSERISERIVTFDGVTHGAFLPHKLVSVEYDQAYFVEAIAHHLNLLFDGHSLVAESITIPVSLTKGI
jgi:DNA-binding LacI/PurR family transcriptional regulator